MPIVTHTISSTANADGSTNNVLRLYDQDGTEYTQTFWAPAGFNLQTKIDYAITAMNETLAEREFNALVGL